MISPQQEHDSNHESKAKKPYATPTIQIFGDLGKITHMMATKNKNDNGGGTNANKT
jgi:hypothetical protein